MGIKLDSGILWLFAWMLMFVIPFGVTCWFLSAFIKKRIYVLIGSIIGTFIFYLVPSLSFHPISSYFMRIYFWGCIVLGLILRLMPKLKAFIHKVKGGVNK